jgi:hypothetical protein
MSRLFLLPLDASLPEAGENCCVVTDLLMEGSTDEL